jgi:hypothetical protein
MALKFIFHEEGMIHSGTLKRQCGYILIVSHKSLGWHRRGYWEIIKKISCIYGGRTPKSHSKNQAGYI